LDRAFIDYARNVAQAWGKEALFTQFELPDLSDTAGWKDFLEANPNHVPALQAYAMECLRREEYERSLTYIEPLEKLLPEDASPSGVWGLKARAYRGLQQPDSERQALVELTDRNADALDALQRLIEIDLEQKRWPEVVQWCNSILAVNPFLAAVHRTRAEAAMLTEKPAIAAESWKAILQLDPIDPAEAHLKYAEACAANAQPSLAERHVLMAIEEAPRYQEALRFFAKLKKVDSLPNRAISPNLQGEPPAPNDVPYQPAQVEYPPK
jgi:tetratricopeptide (TPR) repeat protein